jgi:hypothetical protein
MLYTLKKFIKGLAHKFGYKITKVSDDPLISKDELFMEIYRKCQNYTMTSVERMYALYKAVQYIVDSKLPGDFVECGVWRGGSAMLMAHTLLALGDKSRKIYLYDTFEGMSEPTKQDYKIANEDLRAIDKWKREQRETHNNWDFSPLHEVTFRMVSTGYPEDKMVFIKGKVEDSIPNSVPSKIALLRLDTDWYESTKHELNHLFPLLESNGVLIIDDYGSWAGSKKATDEYFSRRSILLHRIDKDSRIGLKISEG